MDNTSFWIAIASLVATNIASCVGFYYSHKSQRSPLREQLYTKQIEALVEFSIASTRLQKVAYALQDPQLNEDDQRTLDEHWDEISYHLLDITQKGSILFPSTLYNAVTSFRASADAYEIAIVKSENVEQAYYDLMGAASYVMMIGRELVGADNLSIESLNLHSKDGYDKINGIGKDAFAIVSRALWNQSHHKKND